MFHQLGIPYTVRGDSGYILLHLHTDYIQHLVYMTMAGVSAVGLSGSACHSSPAMLLFTVFLPLKNE